MMSQPTVNDLKVLIDSNVFIALEEIGVSADSHSQLAARFQRLATQLGATIVVSAGTRSDLLGASPQIRTKRLEQLKKYHVLQPVVPNPNVALMAGFPAERSGNDNADLEVLNALAASAADWLVTQDADLRKRATKARYIDRVFSLAEAIETLASFVDKPSRLPAVRTVAAYQLSLNAPIFDGIRADYPDFDYWWERKVAREHRSVLLLGSLVDPEGISVLKIEIDAPHGLVGKVLKMSTFKTAEEFRGSRRGEHLLKATIDFARRNSCDRVYLEVLGSKQVLMGWLTEFGFHILPNVCTGRGEVVLAKNLVAASPSEGISPLAYNVAHGPGAVKIDRVHVIPIRAQWHARLLPEAELQVGLFPEQDPCGNAIRKAYLCRSPSRQVVAGDVLCFLRTPAKSISTVTAIGVAEGTVASTSSDDIIKFVGNRTVYTAREIGRLCAAGEVLAIKFRFDRALAPPWTRLEIRTHGVVRGNVQSIQQVQTEGVEWIRQQLEEWR